MITARSSVCVGAISENGVYGNVAGCFPVISSDSEELVLSNLTASLNSDVDGPR